MKLMKQRLVVTFVLRILLGSGLTTVKIQRCLIEGGAARVGGGIYSSIANNVVSWQKSTDMEALIISDTVYMQLSILCRSFTDVWSTT